MRPLFFFLACLFFLMFFAEERVEAQDIDYPPEGLCLVFSGIDYDSPMNYPNAKHITNVIVGSFYFPVIVWETGTSWSGQSFFSYWDDSFKFWSYPDSITSSGGEDTGRGNVWADSEGNLHFAWHQAGNPDGYEIFYTRAILDTSAGGIQYNVERPAVMISETNGIEEFNPAMCLNDDNPYIVWIQGNVLYLNYSIDGGATWVGADTAFVDTMLGSWILPCLAPDPTSGDVWVATNYDANGDSSMDIVTFHYISLNGIWEQEFAALTPDSHPYALPAVSVDYSGIPGIVFQRNIDTNGGMGGLGGYGNVGPVGLLLFTRKVSGTWIPPETLRFSPAPQIDGTSSWPSVGITETNEIYIAFTQDSIDEGFQVFCSKIVSDYGIYDTPRRIVSKYDYNDSLVGGKFPHMTYNFPDTGLYPGPGICWCVLEDGMPPADVYYKHMPLIPTGIEEGESKLQLLDTSIKISPNPFTTTTHISLTFPSIGHGAEGIGQKTSAQCQVPSDRKDIALHIYDLSGRLVKDFSLGTGHSSLGTAVSWDGRDDSGRRVQSGVYFINLKVGEKMLTKKLILLE